MTEIFWITLILLAWWVQGSPPFTFMFLCAVGWVFLKKWPQLRAIRSGKEARRRLDEKEKEDQKATDDFMHPDIEVWEKLGPTPAAREKAIIRMFEDKTRNLSFGVRHRFESLAARTNQGRIGKNDHYVQLRISRSLAAMEQREREFLRTAYLLFNAGKIDFKAWRYFSFAFINGDGKASVDSWSYVLDEQGTGVRNGPTTVRYYQDLIGASVDSAINALLKVIDGAEDARGGSGVVKEVQGRLHGGGAWLKGEDLPDTIYTAKGRYALRLGVLDGTDEVLSYGGEGSLMTIAPPGAGKTQGFVLPNMLTWLGPALVLDVKGEIYADTSKWRSENVGPVYKFSPLDPTNSSCYNPLAFIRPDPEYLWEDSRFLADMMIVPSGAADPFFETSARDVLTAAIAHVCYVNAPDARPMSKVLDLLYGIGWDDMVTSLATNLEVSAMRQVGHSLGEMERKTRDSVLKTAQTSMSGWQGERIGRATRKSDWNPADLRTKNLTVYMCVNPNEIESIRSVLRVFIAQHIRMLTSSLPLRDAAPILFVLDELPQLRKMPPIEDALSIGRQYKIQLWMFTQSYGQLKEAYPNAEGMLGSCAVRVFMNIPLNDELAQKLSDQLGYRDGPLDSTRTKLVEPLELCGPGFADIAIVLGANTKPAKVRKAYARKDPVLQSRIGSL